MGHQQQQYEEMINMQEINYRSSNYYLHDSRGRSRGGDSQDMIDTTDNPTAAAVRSHSMRSSGMSPAATNRWRSRTESEGRAGGGGSMRRSRDRSSSSSGAMLHHRGGGNVYGMDNGGGVTPKISDFFADPRYAVNGSI
jgi:hypothetical protein